MQGEETRAAIALGEDVNGTTLIKKFKQPDKKIIFGHFFCAIKYFTLVKEKVKW